MAADTYMLLASAYPQVHFMQATAGGCTALLELDPKNRYPACAALNELRFGELLKRDVDLVILASIWTPQRTARLAATVRYLRERGVPVLVIGPRPVFPGFVPLLVSAQESTHGLNESLSAQIRRKDDLLHSMRDALPGVDIIDMSGVQCDPECDALDGDRLLYFDAQHFTVRGAEVMGERLAKKLDLRAYIEEKRGADSTPARLP